MSILTITYGYIDDRRRQTVLIELHQSRLRVRDLLREWLEMKVRREGKVVWRTAYHTPTAGVTRAQLAQTWRQFEAEDLFVLRNGRRMLTLDTAWNLSPAESIEILYRHPDVHPRTPEAVPATPSRPRQPRPGSALPQPSARGQDRGIVLATDRHRVA
jgi:hypothetical protein